MKYTIEHQTKYSIRLRLKYKNLTNEQVSLLKGKLFENKNITDIRFFKSVGGINISFNSGKKDIIEFLNNIDMDNLNKEYKEKVSEYNALGPITVSELNARKLDDRIKRHLQNKIVAEAFTDLFLPAPVQLAMHLHEYLLLN
ncbi:MAG: hypothetical protein K6A23_10130 [Butyrivibrio sp.]|nr:hypothetical protein [Butyrivibrio sp.]